MSVQLSDKNVQLRSEYRNGIAKIWLRKDTPPSLTPYLSAVRSLNGFTLPAPVHTKTAASEQPELFRQFHLPVDSPLYPAEAYSPTSLNYYPGSPALFFHLHHSSSSSPPDRLLAMDMHTTEQSLLSQCLSDQKKNPLPVYSFYSQPTTGAASYRMLQEDGFLAYRHVSKHSQVLLFCDPPYELAEEYKRASQLLSRCVSRHPLGQYVLWYPLIKGKTDLVEALTLAIGNLPSSNILHISFDLSNALASELSSESSSSTSSPSPSPSPSSLSSSVSTFRAPRRISLFGCGMVIINPPSHLDTLLSTSLFPYLATVLAEPSMHTASTSTSSLQAANWTVEWMKGKPSENDREGAEQ